MGHDALHSRLALAATDLVLAKWHWRWYTVLALMKKEKEADSR